MQLVLADQLDPLVFQALQVSQASQDPVDLQVRLDLRVRAGRQDLLARLVNKDLLDLQDQQAPLEIKDHKVQRGSQVHLEPLGIKDLRVLQDLQEIKVLKVLQDLQDQQVKVDRLDPQALQVLQEVRAPKDLQDPPVPWVRLDQVEHQAMRGQQGLRDPQVTEDQPDQREFKVRLDQGDQVGT